MSGRPSRILIVDDEDDILDLLRYNLEREGHTVVDAHDGAEAITLAERVRPDLIVMDIMMPRMDGIEACRRLREHATLRTVPLMMLTARSGEEDQIRGLNLGADVYLTKPISIPFFLSQANAMVRRSSRDEEREEIIRIRDLLIDPNRYRVSREGGPEPVRLRRREFELLRFLATRPGRVFTRQELLDQVWGPQVHVVDRTVDVHVRKIREKIGDEYIETVPGVGYGFRES